MTREATYLERKTLECIIDSGGLDALLLAVADICGDRSLYATNRPRRRLQRLEGHITALLPVAEGL